jgi:hypothetical protein
VQVPLPSHVDAFVWVVVFAQDEGRQTLPWSEERQLPAPLQTPSPRQTPVPWVPHSLSGSAPLGTKSQMPSTPEPFFAAVHALHVSVHTALQQIPSAQKPEVQSAPAVHALGEHPVGSGYFSHAPVPSQNPSF